MSEKSSNFAAQKALLGESNVEGRKILRDGQLLIIRDGKTYNAQGAELR